ncbi:MAG: ATP-dependent DNA helicase [Candidatus Woesearchaeota archaeon]
MLFPHTKIRESQSNLVKDIENAIKNKSSIVAHAPTGLGKTAAALVPALSYALENKKIVFFLTSRHTQHTIALDTLRKIKLMNDISFVATDIIGKKWMCLQSGVDLLSTGEFHEFCRHAREHGKCEYYLKTRKPNVKLTTEAKLEVENLKMRSPLDTQEVVEFSKEVGMCPYELSMALSSNANIIIADYYYLFNPSIRNGFFKKAEKELSDAIIIIDEAHNLPQRIRNLLTSNLSTMILKKAISEATKYGYDSLIEKLNEIKNDLIEKTGEKDELLVAKADFVVKQQDEFILQLKSAAEGILEVQKRSFLGIVASFLEAWKGEDEGFIRYVSKKMTKNGMIVSLHYCCLDPSIVAKEVIKQAHSTIAMSGTLLPTSMYRDILGFPENTEEKIYSSPFPQTNRLNLIVPETTTKFSERNEEQFERMALLCAEAVNCIRGNCAVFFPSYFVRDAVYRFFADKCEKTTFLEQPQMTKNDKLELLEKFKSYKDSGAVLIGVAAANFAEGIDLPGDLLKGVVIVGLPLTKPNIETKALIDYYEKKFNKGWDYGYIFPAFNKTLQSAGRCIRSETDRGVIVFIDERYTHPNYFRCFPKEWELKISKNIKQEIEKFFKEKIVTEQ